MADLRAIFSFVTRASSLSLSLFNIATKAPDGNFISQIAKNISNSSLTVKQIGTIIREDDSLPSAEAVHNLDDILESCSRALDEIGQIIYGDDAAFNEDAINVMSGREQHHELRITESGIARLRYLRAHLEALRATISVMLQTLYTAQSIIWTKERPLVSPQQAKAAIANEKVQLENQIIEQQISILVASKCYHPTIQDARLLMENDSSRSLAINETSDPHPRELFLYHIRFIGTLDTIDTSENDWLPSICAFSRSHLEHLLEKWTRLNKVKEQIRDKERKEMEKRREHQQATVESGSEEETEGDLLFRSNHARLATPTPRRPGSVQPLFTETSSIPIPVPDASFGPTAPISPISSFGISPRSSYSAIPPNYSPVSSKSSITSLPVEAAAAVDAKDNHEDVDLEIPWRLSLGAKYWDHVDGRLQKSNTDLPSSHAYSDWKSKTEILASWVCKEALEEAGYKYDRVSKERSDGRRTKLETCFCIRQPLTFDQVHRLVERTVEIYRQTHQPSPSPQLQPPPPPPPRRSSFDRGSSRRPERPSVDRERTPRANDHISAAKQQPTLERPSTTYVYPPPPLLDRSMSMPNSLPIYPSTPTSMPRTSNLQIPLPPPYPKQNPPYLPQPSPYSPHHQSPFFSPTPAFSSLPNPHRPQPTTYPASPLRQSFANTPSARFQDYQSYPSTTSDSDSAPSKAKERDRDRDLHDKERERRYRSRSRRASGSERYDRKKRSTVGTLAKVGGLAALLDGIVDLGVL